jgi:hypothetical protein
MGQYKPGSVGALSNFKFDLNRLTMTDRIVGVATLIAMISIWLPWFTVTVSSSPLNVLGHSIGSAESQSASASGTTAHGWLWLEFFVALIVLVYLVAKAGFDELPVNLPGGHEIRLAAVTGLQFLLLVIAFVAVPSAGDTAELNAAGISASVGWSAGAFIGLLAAIVAAAPVIYPMVRAYLDNRKTTGAGNAPRY